jgi:hypothetical protein
LKRFRTGYRKLDHVAASPNNTTNSWHSDGIAFIAPRTDVAMHLIVGSGFVSVTNTARARRDHLLSTSFEFSLINHHSVIAIWFKLFKNP